MPIGTTASLYAALALVIPSMLATGIAINLMPTPADAWAVVGAMFATTLAIIEGLKTSRDFRQLCFIGISSAGCGAFLPGFMLYNTLSESFTTGLTWHTWALLGALFGAIGSGLVHGAIAWGDKRAAKAVENGMTRWAERFTGKTASDAPPPTEKLH